MQVTGHIPLVLALVERYMAGKLDSLTSDPVVTFLRKHFHWRATDTDGARGHRADVEGLLVSVVSNEVTLPTDGSSRPCYSSEVRAWPAATTRVNGEPRGIGTGCTGANPIDATA
jgi:tyrosinase